LGRAIGRRNRSHRSFGKLHVDPLGLGIGDDQLTAALVDDVGLVSRLFGLAAARRKREGAGERKKGFRGGVEHGHRGSPRFKRKEGYREATDETRRGAGPGAFFRLPAPLSREQM